MAEKNFRSTSDFETQLQLGEKLLNLGRGAEALEELRKASALNEVGRYSSADGSAERAESLERLDSSLRRAESLAQAKTESNSRWWMVSLALALILFGIFFAGWVLNRASMLDMEVASTQEAEVSAAQEKELTNHIDALHAEGTRMSRTNSQLQREIQSLQENNQQIAQAANNNLSQAYVPLQTVAAENAKAVQNMAAIAANRPVSSGSAEIIVITQTVSSGAVPDAAVIVPQIDVVSASNKMRITTNKTNFRYGPGFRYGIQGGLNAGDFVDALARSEDNYWYYVETADNRFGWIHVSLAIPVDFDWLPERESEFQPLPTFTPVPGPSAQNDPSPSAENDPTPTIQVIVAEPTQVVEAVQPTATVEAQPTVLATEPAVIPTAPSTGTVDIAPTPTPADAGGDSAEATESGEGSGEGDGTSGQ